MSIVWRCTYRMHHTDGTLVEPSFHYQTDLGFGDSEPDGTAVANAVDGKLTTALRAATHNSIIVDELVAREEVLAPDIGAVGSHIIAAGGTMSAGAYDLPKALVPLIALKTGVASRSARGHTALAGPGIEAFTTAEKWDASYLTVLGTFAALLDDDVTTAGIGGITCHPVVYSPTRRKRGESPYTFKVTNPIVRTTPHWLRSRLTSP